MYQAYFYMVSVLTAKIKELPRQTQSQKKKHRPKLGHNRRIGGMLSDDTRENVGLHCRLTNKGRERGKIHPYHADEQDTTKASIQLSSNKESITHRLWGDVSQ